MCVAEKLLPFLVSDDCVDLYEDVLRDYRFVNPTFYVLIESHEPKLRKFIRLRGLNTYTGRNHSW